MKVVVLENYKEPKFVSKYDNTGYPKSHLKYYLRKMARYSDNTPLLVSTFQVNLRRAALACYTALDIEDFIEWAHLAGEFHHQYKLNVEVLLTRKDLIRIEKRKNEEFRAYAQRWKAVASQVKPAISKDDLIELFKKSLPIVYYDNLHVSGCQIFTMLVKVGERNEWGLKEKKAQEITIQRPYLEKKDKAHPRNDFGV